MSRGPLEVLREAVAAMPVQMCCGMYVGGGMDENGNGEPPSCCGQPIHTDDVNEAIAQVEALVKAASAGSAMKTAGHGDALYFGASAGYADRLREALAPFTPGQDSEGGGNG